MLVFYKILPTMKKFIGMLAFLGGVIAANAQSGQDVLTFTVNGYSFDMVPVAGGTFTMGATPEQGKDAGVDEKITHSVTLSDYYIGKFEVTQGLWVAVMDSNFSTFQKGDNYPMEYVSWDDCQMFINKLNQMTGKQFRLPTEAEWEFAARGGNKSGGTKFSGGSEIADVAWFESNSDGSTQPVGQKSPNELGIYDMSGNVWEWCDDWYGNYSRSAQTNPKGANKGARRVLRGGCWRSLPKSCRISFRNYNFPDMGSDGDGFRLVYSPK
jgi:formylglycine-generating enzyme required for sulfatase activity